MRQTHTDNTIVGFPFAKTVDRLPNHATMEWIFAAVQGLPPARQKRLILQARSPEVAVIDDVDAGIMLDALGIRET